MRVVVVGRQLARRSGRQTCAPAEYKCWELMTLSRRCALGPSRCARHAMLAPAAAAALHCVAALPLAAMHGALSQAEAPALQACAAALFASEWWHRPPLPLRRCRPRRQLVLQPDYRWTRQRALVMMQSWQHPTSCCPRIVHWVGVALLPQPLVAQLVPSPLQSRRTLPRAAQNQAVLHAGQAVGVPARSACNARSFLFRKTQAARLQQQASVRSSARARRASAKCPLASSPNYHWLLQSDQVLLMHRSLASSAVMHESSKLATTHSRRA